MAKQQRPAKGATIPVPSGTGDRSVRIHGPSLPRPNVGGFASACYAVDRKDYIEVVFFNNDAAPARTIVRFVVAMDSLVNTLWPGSVQFFDSLRDGRTGLGTIEYQLSDVAPGDLPAPVRADLMMVARSGLSTDIELHAVNVWSAHHSAISKGKVTTYPLVVVQTPVGLLFALLTFFKDVVAQHSERIHQLKKPNA